MTWEDKQKIYEEATRPVNRLDKEIKALENELDELDGDAWSKVYKEKENLEDKLYEARINASDVIISQTNRLVA